MTLQECLDFFEIPNLEGQTEETLKKQFYRLAQKHHPDKGGSFEQFIKLQEAYSNLQEAILDKNFGNYQTNGSYAGGESENAHYSNYSTEANYEDVKAQMEMFKEAYQKTRKILDRCNDVFNQQIKLFNETVVFVETLIQDYDIKKDKLKVSLNFNLNLLEQSYHKKWWENLVPSQKLTKEEYVMRSNSYIRDYNLALEQIEKDFMNELLRTYQDNFRKAMDLLQFE